MALCAQRTGGVGSAFALGGHRYELHSSDRSSTDLQMDRDLDQIGQIDHDLDQIGPNLPL